MTERCRTAIVASPSAIAGAAATAGGVELISEPELHQEARRRELAAIVEWSNDAIIGKRLDGTITSWNPAAERMYGYSAAEAVGRSIAMLEPTDRRGEIRGLLERVRAGQQIEGYETVRLRKDGSPVDVLLTISPIRDDDAGVVGACTIAHDLSQRRAVESALRQSEASYRRLFEEHPAPMWVYDPATMRFLAVNAAVVEASGYTGEEFLAMTVTDVLDEDERERLDRHVGTFTEDTRGLWRLRLKDGSRIDVATWGSAIEFEGHDARLVLTQDVTEQRRLEEELRQTQKMDAIGRLAGGIAHDFNNLLLVIRGYSAILLARLSGADRNDVLQIDCAAERASEFTRQLLAFSRQQVLRPVPLDVNEVVGETLTLLRRSLEKDIDIETDLDPAVGLVLLDRSELTKAILNLAINARDAMPDGGTLHIRTRNVELAGDDQVAAAVAGPHVLLQVTDSGTGMDEETRRRAFDPFFTTKEDGTGLGLAAIYGLVKQSGGHILLSSEPGRGTTFKLYFPVTDTEPLPAGPQVPVGSLAGNQLILVVEDTDIVRDLVTALLESYGYEILAASSALEALVLAENLDRPIDLLLTDVVMRGMNGRELAERLVAARPDLKVLFTSGYPADTVIRHGIADARTAFIEKPYLPDELARKVREILARDG
jgi:PAS domain S-box-containing protein